MVNDYIAIYYKKLYLCILDSCSLFLHNNVSTRITQKKEIYKLIIICHIKKDMTLFLEQKTVHAKVLQNFVNFEIVWNYYLFPFRHIWNSYLLCLLCVFCFSSGCLHSSKYQRPKEEVLKKLGWCFNSQ